MRRKPRKFKNLFLSVLIVAAAVAYIIYGERIAELLGNFAEGLEYPSLPKTFISGLSEDEIQIHVIDVGQAESILVRSNYGNILIDAGTNDSEADIRAHLDACGVDTIDYLICSHPHDDHIGGADMVIDCFAVGTVFMSSASEESFPREALEGRIEKYNIDAVYPSPGDEYTLGDIKIKFLAPLEYTDDTNNMSLVFKLTYGEMDFLFTGDITSKSEKLMLDAYSAAELDCEFLKLAHHGANTASSAEFLTAVSPQIAVSSSGKDNDYSHPRGEVLARLAAVGCETILRTDKMGTVIISSDGHSLAVIEQ